MKQEKDADTNKNKNDSMESGSPLPRHSRHQVVTEQDFIEPLIENARPFFEVAGIVLNDKVKVSTRFFFNIMNEAEKLQSFLDDYGARLNKKWYYFTELIASVRNFAVAAFELSHILNRYGDYFYIGEDDSLHDFLEHAKEVTEFINKIQRNLIKEALKELSRNGCDLGEIDIAPYRSPDTSKAYKLPNDIMLEEYKTSELRIMRIAETYRKMALKIHRDKYGNRPEPEKLAEMIPSRLNETKVKVLENTLHSIQSEYDTHVRQTYFERITPELSKLRAGIAVPMHLLEMARWIIHFYERHENEIQVDESRNRIAKIVNKNEVLKILSHFAFYYAHMFVMEHKPIAEKIMTMFVRKSEIELPIPKPSGFHARPAYYVTLVVEEHGTDVFMFLGNRKFDARSVLDLLEAGGLAADEDLETVIFEGDERTLADLKILAESNYCENEVIPKELNYIRVARNIMT